MSAEEREYVSRLAEKLRAISIDLNTIAANMRNTATTWQLYSRPHQENKK